VGEVFKGLKVTSYYKYLLVLCGTILVLSLFWEVKGIDNWVAIHYSKWIIAGSLIIWVWEGYINWLNKLNLDNKSSAIKRTIINWLVQILVWVIIFVIIFITQ
jgi:hypothetical protein